MADAAKNLADRNRWLIGAGWLAGISIVLVEMQVGMDYVQTRLAEHARTMAGWLPMVGTLMCRFVGTFVPAPLAGQSLARLALFTAIPLALALAGWAIKDRALEKQGRAE